MVNAQPFLAEQVKPRWVAAGFGTVFIPVLLLGLYPAAFVRTVGCSGDLDGVAVAGSRVVVAEKIGNYTLADQPLHLVKVSLVDASTGKTVAGPWVHDMDAWVGLFGNMYCLSGDGLLCASLETGEPRVNKVSLEAQRASLKGDWQQGPTSQYEIASPGVLAFKTDDGHSMLLSADLSITEGTAPRDSGQDRSTTRAVPGKFTLDYKAGSRATLKFASSDSLSTRSWLEPSFLVDRVTGRPAEVGEGWLLTSVERRVGSKTSGVSVSAIDERGNDLWKTTLGDNLQVTEAYVVGDQVILRTAGDRVTLQALELASGKLRWIRNYSR